MAVLSKDMRDKQFSMSLVRRVLTFFEGKIKNVEEVLKEIKLNTSNPVKVETHLDIGGIEKPLKQLETALSAMLRNMRIMVDTSEEGKRIVSAVQQVEKAIKTIPQPKQTVFPAMKFPENVSVRESGALITAIQRVETAIQSLSLASSRPSSSPVSVDVKGVIEAIKELKKTIEDAPKTEKTEFPQEIFVNPGSAWPVPKIPQPVTHMSINSLKGIVHTTAATVTTALTPLPIYGVLENRRAVIIYNNSSTITIYVGGSDVTSNNGLPVPPNSYSPIFDAGIHMVIYGVTASGTANVRIGEISDEASGR